MYNQWITFCPICGTKESLYVVSFRIDGCTIKKTTKLYSEGFIINLEPPKIMSIDANDDLSPEDERVRCVCCKSEFDLNELKVENYSKVEEVISCPWDKLPLMVGTVSGNAAKALETRLKHFPVYDKVRKSNMGASRKDLKGEIKIAEILVKAGHLCKSFSNGLVTYHVRKG